MKVEIKIIPDLQETTVKIETSEITGEIHELLERINNPSKKPITGIKDERIFILNPEDINFFFCEKQKVFANCDSSIYEVRHKLYELEEQLKNSSYIRLSKSAIANVDKINNLEMSFNGSMCVNFKNGTKEFLSRKYVADMKNYLRLGGN